MTWGMPIKDLERRVAQSRMRRSIVPKFGKGNPADPLLGTRVDETTKKSFKALIDSFGLPIGLWVVSRAHA